MLASDETRAQRISAAFADRTLLKDPDTQQAVFATIADLDEGRLRVAVPTDLGWQTQVFVKQAVLLYFVLRPAVPMDAGVLSFVDKVPVKDAKRAQVSRLIVELYRMLVHEVVAAEFPRQVASIPTRMIQYVKEGIYDGEVIAQDTKAVVVALARAGLLPSQVSYDFLNHACFRL